jgi:plastocyanin
MGVLRAIAAIVAATTLAASSAGMQTNETVYLPNAIASRTVTVTKDARADAGVTVLTQAVAINETGPKDTVARFGEVYAFTPAFIAVHRDEPTVLSFWNLQSDDEHDFMLADARSNVLMHVLLPALQETSYTFTFHREGLFTFYCTMHQPAMSGQILVLPASPKPASRK